MAKIMSRSMTHSRVLVKAAVTEVMGWLLICHVKTLLNRSNIFIRRKMAHLKHTNRVPMPACKLPSHDLSFLHMKKIFKIIFIFTTWLFPLPALHPVVRIADWFTDFTPTPYSVILCRPMATARFPYSLASEHNRTLTKQRTRAERRKENTTVMRQRPHFHCFCLWGGFWYFLPPRSARPSSKSAEVKWPVRWQISVQRRAYRNGCRLEAAAVATSCKACVSRSQQKCQFLCGCLWVSWACSLKLSTESAPPALSIIS